MAHNIHTVISNRAYGLWESEGCPDGHALEHWLRAEREILLESNDDPRADLVHLGVVQRGVRPPRRRLVVYRAALPARELHPARRLPLRRQLAATPNPLRAPGAPCTPPTGAEVETGP